MKVCPKCGEDKGYAYAGEYRVHCLNCHALLKYEEVHEILKEEQHHEIDSKRS